MKVFIGSDHNGFNEKQALIAHLKNKGVDAVDLGDKVLDPNDDFPVYAQAVVQALIESKDSEDKGILLCGSGQGMVMAANRFKGIRAGIVWDNEEAKMVRNDDDANVLCIPARILNSNQTINITDTWLNTPFSGAPRFVRRIKEIDRMG
jgi:ribose 5-phosphate isomerase B